MRILVLIAGVLAAGIALVLLALTFPQPELQAERIEQPEQAGAAPATSVASNTGAPAEQEVEVIAVVQPPVQQAATPSLTATQEACRTLEARQLEDVQDAEARLDDAQEEYEDVKDTYDDVLENRDHDDAYVAKIRAERDAAKEEMDDAEKDRDNAIRKLSRTRIECDLYS